MLSLSTAVADSVEMHQTQTVKGVMQMRQVTLVSCPAGATVKAQAGGLHIMLLGLKRPWWTGSSLNCCCASVMRVRCGCPWRCDRGLIRE